TAVFVVRFVPARLLLIETARPAIAAVIVLLAAFAFGRLALRIVRLVIPTLMKAPCAADGLAIPSPGLRPPSPEGRVDSVEGGLVRVVSLLPPGEGARSADEGRVTSGISAERSTWDDKADALLIGFATFGIIAGATALISTTIAPILA